MVHGELEPLGGDRPALGLGLLERARDLCAAAWRLEHRRCREVDAGLGHVLLSRYDAGLVTE